MQQSVPKIYSGLSYYILKLLAVLVFAFFTYRAFNATLSSFRNGEAYFLNILFFIGELVTLIIILFSRTPKDATVTFKTSFFTFGGTYYMVLIQFVGEDNWLTKLFPSLAGSFRQTYPLISSELAATLLIIGVIWAITAKVYLGRSFGLLPANRGIVNTGPYRYFRHPIYFGYLIGHIGFLLGSFSYWNLFILTVTYIFQCFRIIEEEKVLCRDEEYRVYTKEVRYRLFPFIF